VVIGRSYMRSHTPNIRLGHEHLIEEQYQLGGGTTTSIAPEKRVRDGHHSFDVVSEKR